MIPSQMRKTLRRSCAACAKAKTSCSLNIPKCLRCVRRKSTCVYANEPLTSEIAGWAVARPTKTLSSTGHKDAPRLLDRIGLGVLSNASKMPMSLDGHLFDPFDSYPTTSLPRMRVQGLMQHFLTKIAYQYYPLDLNPGTNPFVASWWPSSLQDPLLFHVTLQTASWDDEMLARRGFPHSELLLKDSVSLLRHKVEDQLLAFQNATMNAVIILAAIEHGKGNLHVSRMHIDGVKRMVDVRGGLIKIKETSQLTARMVPWVSLLVTGSPQFESQDDSGAGNGVSKIPQWQHDLPLDADRDSLDLGGFAIDPTLLSALNKLRFIFVGTCDMDDCETTSVTEFHDLTSFVLHRLLSLSFATKGDLLSSIISESLRVGIAIHFLTAHGPTYYSHTVFLHSLILRLKYQLGLLAPLGGPDSCMLWLLSVGAVAAKGTDEREWFQDRITTLYRKMDIRSYEDFEDRLTMILWLQSRSKALFLQLWEELIT